MERTRLFQEHVKSLKAHNKITYASGNVVKLSRKDEFVKKIEIVLTQISELRNFLLNYKEKLLKLAYDSITSLSVTDNELEKVDLVVQRISRNCFNSLKELSTFIITSADQQNATQNYTHQKILIELVRNYLIALHKLYAEYKAVWVKRNYHYREMASIALNSVTSKKDKPQISTKPVKCVQDAESSIINDSDDVNRSNISEMSEYELKVLETENTNLFDELNGLLSEVGHIEKKVTSLTELQDVFTHEVLQQDTKIERIDNTVSSVSQDVQDANDQLKEAMRNNASLRLYLLFFILGLCFALLFLNWYNE